MVESNNPKLHSIAVAAINLMSIIVMITMMMATMVMTLLASLTKVENRGGKVCFSFSNERRGAEGGAAAAGEWQGVAIIIIIITRPWPAYGRHGLAGSLGGDQSGRKNSLHSIIEELARFARSDWMGLLGGDQTCQIKCPTCQNDNCPTC